MANANEESLDDEKFLFAAEMVKFLLNKKHPHLTSEYEKSEVWEKAVSCRIRVRNRFSENIKNMVEMIDETQSVLVRRDFLEIKDQDGINESSLMEYNDTYKDCHFDEGFQAKNFLMYCARSVLMACYFFANGRKDDLRIVVDLIQTTFPQGEDECKLVWDTLDNAALKHADATKSDLPGDSASYLSRREPPDLISSETEESSSSTINSESDSVVEMQNVTSASSAESLTTAITKLNVSSMECTEYPQSKESSTTTEDPDGKVVTTSEPSSSSISSIRNVFISNVEGSIKNTFLKIEGESSAKNIPVKSPIKSCLGKRPSPRKASELRGTSSVKPSGSAEDSETQIKKPKLSLPDASD